jgi:hypothetical protein
MEDPPPSPDKWGDEDFEWPDHEESTKPRPVDRWRHNTASGAVAAAIALGLQQVFDPVQKDTIAIEQEMPDKPGEPGQVELNFDPTDFRATSIVIRHPPPPPD